MATHLGVRPAERRRHVVELVEALRGAGGPFVVGGDLNEFPGRGAAALLADRFADAWVVTRDRAPAEAGETLPAAEPTARIDYLFVSEGVAVEWVEVPSTAGARIASDHRPVVADLRVSEPSPGP